MLMVSRTEALSGSHPRSAAENKIIFCLKIKYNDEILNSLSVWNQGKSITYVITIGNEEAVIDFAADVGGWEDGSPNIVPVQ